MADDQTIDSRWNAARRNLIDAAATAGVDAGLLVKIAGFESGFDPNARPVAGRKHAELNTVTQFDGTKAMSSAHGYGQFLNATWGQMVRDHGEKYGVPHAPDLTNEQANTPDLRNDTRLQAGMLAEFTKANADTAASLGGLDAAANVYAMHNLGSADGSRFLRAMAADPEGRVDSVLSSKVIEVNRSLYGDGSISLAQAYTNMGAHMERYASYAAEVSGQSHPGPTDSSVHAASDVARVHVVMAGGSSATVGRTMREGMHGEDVRALQRHLSDVGVTAGNGGPLKSDGDFGPMTRAAVEAFQAKSHLNVDGVVGPVTLGRLSARAGEQGSGSQETLSETKPLLHEPAHPGYGLYRQAFDGMQKIDAGQGRSSDDITERVAGAVAAASYAQGLSRIDIVALSADAKQCWASQGQTNDPFKRLANVSLDDAINTSLARSTAVWEQASQQQEVQATRSLQAETQVQQHGPVR